MSDNTTQDDKGPSFDYEGMLAKLRDDSRGDSSLMPRCIVFAVILMIADVCVDVFLHMDGIWMTMVRTLLAVVTALPLFVIGYELAWRQHDANQEKADEDGERYISYRFRYSASQRLRQSLIFFAVLVLIAIITSYTPVYTIGASIIITGMLGIAAYCRLTDDEKFLRDHDMPDLRDVMEEADRMDNEMTNEAERELRREEINRRKRALRRKRRGLDDDDDDYDDEDDDEDGDYDDDDEDGDHDDDDEYLSSREKRKAKRASTFSTLFG